MNGMQQQAVRANGVRFNVWVGGKGPPVVLLHGFPQTALMWRKIVPQLLPGHAVVCPDLRGYGDSDKPQGGCDKRTMALEVHGRALPCAHFIPEEAPEALLAELLPFLQQKS